MPFATVFLEVIRCTVRPCILRLRSSGSSTRRATLSASRTNEVGETYWKVKNESELMNSLTYEKLLSRQRHLGREPVVKNADQQMPQPEQEILTGIRQTEGRYRVQPRVFSLFHKHGPRWPLSARQTEKEVLWDSRALMPLDHRQLGTCQDCCPRTSISASIIRFRNQRSVP